jgi:hypothetical protein
MTISYNMQYHRTQSMSFQATKLGSQSPCPWQDLCLPTTPQQPAWGFKLLQFFPLLWKTDETYLGYQIIAPLYFTKEWIMIIATKPDPKEMSKIKWSTLNGHHQADLATSSKLFSARVFSSSFISHMHHKWAYKTTYRFHSHQIYKHQLQKNQDIRSLPAQLSKLTPRWNLEEAFHNSKTQIINNGLRQSRDINVQRVIKQPGKYCHQVRTCYSSGTHYEVQSAIKVFSLTLMNN